MKNELECRSERMCIHVGFLRDIVHLIVSSEVVNFTTSDKSFPSYQSLRTRGRWVGHLFEFRPVQSDTSLQIPIKRSLDLFRLMWWISYLGFQYGMWRISHLLGSDVSPNLLKRFGRSWWCLSVTVVHQLLAILAKRAS
jgi:hypothetical protein